MLKAEKRPLFYLVKISSVGNEVFLPYKEYYTFKMKNCLYAFKNTEYYRMVPYSL